MSIYCILSYACNEGATSYTGGARGGGKVYGWHYTPVTPVGIEVATPAAAPTSKLVTAYHCSANPCACVATKLTRASPTTEDGLLSTPARTAVPSAKKAVVKKQRIRRQRRVLLRAKGFAGANGRARFERAITAIKAKLAKLLGVSVERIEIRLKDSTSAAANRRLLLLPLVEMEEGLEEDGESKIEVTIQDPDPAESAEVDADTAVKTFESKSAVELSTALGIDVEGQATVLTESPTESPTEAPTESPTESPTDSPTAPTAKLASSEETSAPTIHTASLKAKQATPTAGATEGGGSSAGIICGVVLGILALALVAGVVYTRREKLGHFLERWWVAQDNRDAVAPLQSAPRILERPHQEADERFTGAVRADTSLGRFRAQA